MNARQQSSRKFWTIGIAAVLGLSGIAAAFWQPGFLLKGAAAPTTPAYQTAAVQRGSIALTAAGTGSLVAAKTVNMSLPASGKIGQLAVQVGDTVKAGQTLAALDNIEQLKQAVDDASISLLVAQSTLNTYMASADTNLAQAYSDLAAAEKNLVTAQQNLRQKGDPRCDPKLTEQYYFDYLYAQKAVDGWEQFLSDPKTGYGHDFLIKTLTPLRQKRDLAYINWNYCQGYTDQEIANSQANLKTAQAALASAQASYQVYQASNGLDLPTLAIDQAAVENAQAQLNKAQSNLAGSVLIAPMDGTVTAVNGVVGLPAASGPVITLADLNDPQVQASFDETDLANIALDCPAQVSFNAIPGKTFTGTISQILPELASSNNVTAAQALISLKNYAQEAGQPLPLGASASVQVTCQQASDILQIPVPAVHTQAGQSYVFVLNALGQPEKRVVTVGLKTSAFAQITSGLKQGERVITSQVRGQ